MHLKCKMPHKARLSLRAIRLWTNLHIYKQTITFLWKSGPRIVCHICPLNRAFQSILNGNQEKECIRQQFYATARFLITTNKNIDNHQGPSEQVCHFSEAELEDWNSSAHSDLFSSNFSQAPRHFYFLSRDLVFRVLLLCGHRDQPLITHRSPRTVHWEQTSNEYF